MGCKEIRHRVTMQITATIDASQLEAALERRLEGLPQRIMAAMAEHLRDIVNDNFGPTGNYRPFPWAPLSNRAPYFYATQVGRPFATLHETGKLQSALKTSHFEDHSRVSMSNSDCNYVTRHHYGDDASNLPARRVFPIELNGEVTEKATSEVIEIANMELMRILA